MKSCIKTIVFVGLTISFSSCYFINIDFCPASQRLGQLRLTAPDFSPYQGNEILTFTNLAGRQLVLTNFRYATLSTQQRLIVTVPCYHSDFSKQELYYDSPRTFISYQVNKDDYLK